MKWLETGAPQCVSCSVQCVSALQKCTIPTFFVVTGLHFAWKCLWLQTISTYTYMQSNLQADGWRAGLNGVQQSSAIFKHLVTSVRTGRQQLQRYRGKTRFLCWFPVANRPPRYNTPCPPHHTLTHSHTQRSAVSSDCMRLAAEYRGWAGCRAATAVMAAVTCRRIVGESWVKRLSVWIIKLQMKEYSRFMECLPWLLFEG